MGIQQMKDFRQKYYLSPKKSCITIAYKQIQFEKTRLLIYMNSKTNENGAIIPSKKNLFQKIKLKCQKDFSEYEDKGLIYLFSLAFLIYTCTMSTRFKCNMKTLNTIYKHFVS